MRVEVISPAGYKWGRTASGRPIMVAPGGEARFVTEDDLIEQHAFQQEFEFEGPTCSICDSLGHGYPGGPPCPLEDDGRWEPDPEPCFTEPVLSDHALFIQSFLIHPDWSAATHVDYMVNDEFRLVDREQVAAWLAFEQQALALDAAMVEDDEEWGGNEEL